MNFRVFEDLESLSTAAAEELARVVERQEQTSVLLSGGSTPRRMYELLGSAPLRGRLAAREVVWATADERDVPPDHEESNSRMIRETLFALGVPERHTFIRFRTELGEPERIAAEFERELRGALADRPVDLATLGAGEDGHTASLFPGTSALEEDERCAVAVRVPRLEAWRFTVTLPLLANARARWVLAQGASKRAMIERVEQGADLPVALVSRSGETWWLVDRAAWDPEHLLGQKGRA